MSAINSRRMWRKGKRFTIMAAGSVGCGKTTLFNNLVARQIINNKAQGEIDVYMLNLDGIGVQRNIVFIDTPGFGAGMNDEAIQDSIVEYIREQFDLYIEEEAKIRRDPKYEDTRVHCLLYLIPATGNGLKIRDVVFLKKVAPYVNIIPVISRGDALSDEGKCRLRGLVNDQLRHYAINSFDFTSPELVPLSVSRTASEYPFVTVCSDDYSGVASIKRHIAGYLEIDDPNYSDLVPLRETLLDKCMESLMDTTTGILYERYRTEVLEAAINQ